MWQTLIDGANALGLPLEPVQLQALQDYVSQLLKWNRVTNLTAITDKRKIITHHLLDSLAVIPHLKGPRIADLGSGAGLPGIPMAILRPSWQLYLIESNHKKVHFLLQIKQLLHLDNVTVIAQSSESYQPEHRFDTITARAVSSLGQVVALSAHLCRDHGQFALMKGHYPEQELGELGPDCVVKNVIALKVPGLEAARHLVCIQLADNEGESD